MAFVRHTYCFDIFCGRRSLSHNPSNNRELKIDTRVAPDPASVHANFGRSKPFFELEARTEQTDGRAERGTGKTCIAAIMTTVG